METHKHPYTPMTLIPDPDPDTQKPINTHKYSKTLIDTTTALLHKCKLMCKLLLPVYDVSASKSNNKSYFYSRREQKYDVMTSITFTPAAVKSKILTPLHRHEKQLKSCMCYKKMFLIKYENRSDILIGCFHFHSKFIIISLENHC